MSQPFLPIHQEASASDQGGPGTSQSPWFFQALAVLIMSLPFFMFSVPATAACQLSPGTTTDQLVLPLRAEVRHDHYNYFGQLLQLALDKTAQDHGPCEVILSQQAKPQARLYQELSRQENIHIIDATVMPERNERFRAIPFPLLKGLMGYRIAFIRADDQPRFNQVEKLEDLRAFRAGQGDTWFDVQVLRMHGIPVTTTSKYESLFRMLRAGRFDFFPRGAQEVMSEAESFDISGLTVESSLALAYPWPVYFYVNKEHTLLAERVEEGLKRARADGSFDEFFRAHPLIIAVFEQLNLEQRTLLYLCNPQHSDPALLQQSDAWIRPWPEDLCARFSLDAATVN